MNTVPDKVDSAGIFSAKHHIEPLCHSVQPGKFCGDVEMRSRDVCSVHWCCFSVSILLSSSLELPQGEKLSA